MCSPRIHFSVFRARSKRAPRNLSETTEWVRQPVGSAGSVLESNRERRAWTSRTLRGLCTRRAGFGFAQEYAVLVLAGAALAECVAVRAVSECRAFVFDRSHPDRACHVRNPDYSWRTFGANRMVPPQREIHHPALADELSLQEDGDE
jgi:hypothetical protein